jgi:membrane associated rhomboid family serine protease
MATICFFLVGVASLLLFDPMVTAYLNNEPSWAWWFISLFTHMVSHANWGHLLGNYIMGMPYMLYLENRLKDTKLFVRLFFVLGFCALIGQKIADQISIFQVKGLIGSSGAIFGIIGAALSLYEGPKILKVAARSLLLFFITTQFLSAKAALSWPMGVAYAAHLGGLIGGVLFSLHYRRRHRHLSHCTRANRSQKRRP